MVTGTTISDVPESACFVMSTSASAPVLYIFSFITPSSLHIQLGRNPVQRRQRHKMADAQASAQSPPPKDLEGVPDVVDGPVPKPKKSRQKKIAVLTSGGDSAGMNAAGE